MRRHLLFLSLALVGLYLAAPVLAEVAPTCLSEKCAEQLLETMDLKYRESAKRLNSQVDPDVSTVLELRDVLKHHIEQLKNFEWKQFKSPLLRRQFEVLLRELKYPDLNEKFREASKTLNSLGSEKFVCEAVKGRRAPTCTPMSFNEDIKPIIAHGNSWKTIKYYWSEWRNRLPSNVKDALHYYIEYYQNISTAEMSPSAVWYDQYEEGNLLSDLESAMETIAPLYKQWHAHFRQTLRQSYGDDVIPESGLIPHHLMERALFQSAEKDPSAQYPFPQNELPQLHELLSGMNDNAFNLIKIGARFFDSMGFLAMEKDYMYEHFHALDDDIPDCQTYIFTRGDIELDYCPEVNYQQLLTRHGDVAQIEYALLTEDNGLGVSQEACPGFGNALSVATVLAAASPKHLQQHLKLLSDYKFEEELSLNFLYRMAFHALLTIPTQFVHEKLWVDMLDGKVTPKNYNCHYWNLMEKYMGVEPSAQTDSEAYDMPLQFYKGVLEQSRSTKKLFGEFMGYQLYREICLQIHEYEPGYAPRPLFQCNFAGNKVAGNRFEEIMNPGATQQWREIIRELTLDGTTVLQGKAIVDYYEPLQKWFIENNAAKNLTIGWESNDYCKADRKPSTNCDSLFL